MRPLTDLFEYRGCSEDLFLTLLWCHSSSMVLSVGTTAYIQLRWKQLDKLIVKASSVLGCPFDQVQVVGDRRTLAKITSFLIMAPTPCMKLLQNGRGPSLTDCCILGVQRNIIAGSSAQQLLVWRFAWVCQSSHRVFRGKTLFCSLALRA